MSTETEKKQGFKINNKHIWSTQNNAQDSFNKFKTSSPPNATALGDNIFTVWHGESDDDTIWYSIYNTTDKTWTEQTQAKDKGGLFRLSFTPSVTEVDGNIFMAWHGADSDNTIWYSVYDPSSDNWSTQSQAKDLGGLFLSNFSPSVTTIGSDIFLAWHGESDDDTIWYSIYNTTDKTWTTQDQAKDPGGLFRLNYSPCVTHLTDQQIFMTWHGAEDDNTIWHSIYDTSNKKWSVQKNIKDNSGAYFRAAGAPSVAKFTENGDVKLYLAWYGSSYDGIWCSAYDVDSNNWNTQVKSRDFYNYFGTQDSPTVASYPKAGRQQNEMIFMAWQGAIGDVTLWHSQMEGQPFNPSSWMAFLHKNYPAFGQKTLKDIVVPATHDSGMYTGRLRAVFGKSQDQNLFEQLAGGVRYFDLRPQYYRGEYYIYHGPTTGPKLDEVLGNIANFCAQSDFEETVVIKFSHYDSIQTPNFHFNTFQSKVHQALDPYLYAKGGDSQRIADTPLEKLKGKVIVVCDSYKGKSVSQPNIYNYRGVAGDEVRSDMAMGDLNVYDYYADTTDLSAMISDQKQKYEDYNGYSPDSNYKDVACDLYLVSWTLTPVTFIWHYAQKCNPVLVPNFVKTFGQPNANNLLPNIIYLDYYEYSGVMQICFSMSLDSIPSTN